MRPPLFSRPPDTIERRHRAEPIQNRGVVCVARCHRRKMLRTPIVDRADCGVRTGDRGAPRRWVDGRDPGHVHSVERRQCRWIVEKVEQRRAMMGLRDQSKRDAVGFGAALQIEALMNRARVAGLEFGFGFDLRIGFGLCRLARRSPEGLTHGTGEDL